MLTISFLLILLGMAAIVPLLRFNKFYLLSAAMVVGAAYYFENNVYAIKNIFTYKTVLLFVLFHLLCINLTTFIAYGVDKRAAIKKSWRVSEKDLHTLEFLGGWIGALVAQKFFHHKTAKKSYQNIYRLMIVLEFGAIIVLLKFFGFI